MLQQENSEKQLNAADRCFGQIHWTESSTLTLKYPERWKFNGYIDHSAILQ